MKSLTPEQCETIVKSARAAFEQDLGWSKIDAATGVMHLALLLLVLSKHNTPLFDKRYPEVLRVAANLLEISREEMNK